MIKEILEFFGIRKCKKCGRYTRNLLGLCDKCEMNIILEGGFPSCKEKNKTFIKIGFPLTKAFIEVQKRGWSIYPLQLDTEYLRKQLSTNRYKCKHKEVKKRITSYYGLGSREPVLQTTTYICERCKGVFGKKPKGSKITKKVSK